ATASSLNNLAMLHGKQQHYAQALPLLKRALAIYEQALGVEHPDTQQVRENYTHLRQVAGDAQN
ncbi:MAG TPA: tetratricopeptide repeat protein, partial [Ktedonobacteraceae bacterium]|nr:tetratricopeptide repeat protein [Ktedonobacteraceae bacterium]